MLLVVRQVREVMMRIRWWVGNLLTPCPLESTRKKKREEDQICSSKETHIVFISNLCQVSEHQLKGFKLTVKMSLCFMALYMISFNIVW